MRLVVGWCISVVNGFRVQALSQIVHLGVSQIASLVLDLLARVHAAEKGSSVLFGGERCASSAVVVWDSQLDLLGMSASQPGVEPGQDGKEDLYGVPFPLTKENLDGKFLLAVALSIINSVTILDGCFQVNRHQCQRLVDLYKTSKILFQKLSVVIGHEIEFCPPIVAGLENTKFLSSEDKSYWNIQPLLSTINILISGQRLVYEYTEACSRDTRDTQAREDWVDSSVGNSGPRDSGQVQHTYRFSPSPDSFRTLESMLDLGVDQNRFVHIYAMLEECIWMIHLKYYDQLPFDRALTPLFFHDEDERDELFTEDACKDRNHMLEMIGGGALGMQEWRLELKHRQLERPLHLTGWLTYHYGLAGHSLSGNLVPISLRSILKKLSRVSEELPSYLRIDSSEIELHEKIGSGASADIHKCQWEHYDYAVKIFNTDGAREGMVALRKEVQNLIELPRHPNIVDLVGFSVRQSDKRPMVVMELLDCDLMTVIRTGEYKVESELQRKMNRLLTAFMWNRTKKLRPFPIGVAVDFIHQIATGMAFLHRRRIFHGDLKALNVLVKKHRECVQLKISDFGVSEKLIRKPYHAGSDSDCSSFNTANAGTPRWMAPEVYGIPGAHIEPYSMKADVYSFSMTCVEILTGDVPFPEHRFTSNKFREHVRGGGRPELPTTGDVPEKLHWLIARCWDSNPVRRPEFSEICSHMQALKERFPLDGRNGYSLEKALGRTLLGKRPRKVY